MKIYCLIIIIITIIIILINVITCQSGARLPSKPKEKSLTGISLDDDEGISSRRIGGPPPSRGRGPPPGRGYKKNRPEVTTEDDSLYGVTFGTSDPRYEEDDGVVGITLGGADDFDDSNPSSRPKGKKPKKPKPNRGNGNKKPKPRPSQTTSPPKSEISGSEWRSLTRLKHHWENTAHTRSALAKKFVFFLDRDSDYSKHGACLTPSQDVGHCHFIQHCPLPEVIRSFDTFLKYACFIRNRYVGICCPDSYIEGEGDEIRETVVRPQSRPVSKPQTSRPNKRPSENSNDGSDYDNGECGDSPNTRIIGGALANPKEWLWMAAILLRSETKPFCGGVLLNTQFVLTAAHCLKDETPDSVSVRLGAYDFSSAADPEARDFDIDYFKIHPKYNRITNENDLAIIKLRTKSRYSESIKPICLPQKNRNYAGQLAIVAGWGYTSFGGRSSNQLRQVSLPVWNNTHCDSAFSVAITDTMLCAGNPRGGKDSCQGDSGGPLMLQGPNKKWMVIGVVSWGIKCGEPGFPGVYTRISKYIDWVKANAKD